MSLRRRAPAPRLTPGRLRAVLLLTVALAGTTLAVAAHASGLLNGPERQTIDARFSVRGSLGPDPRLAIIAIDSNTLQRLNVQSPIPRGYFARLLDELRGAQPRLIAVDLEFKGASGHPDQDRALLSAIARDGPVLMGAPDPGSETFRKAPDNRHEGRE